MATEQDLMNKRAQVIAEIKRRGGQEKAPGFTKQLDDIDRQLKAIRGGGQKADKRTFAQKQITPVKTGSKEVNQAMKTEQEVGAIEAINNLKYGNAGTQTNPFGTQTITQDEQGNTTVNQSLAPEQQDIYNAGTGLTSLGQSLAKTQLEGYNPFSMGQDTVADRARIEDDVYGRLTRTTDRDYNREKEQLEQTLYNRGIPLDPNNPAYKANMDALNERYDTLRSNARAQATELGGQEYQRSANIGLAGQQQRMSDIASLQGMGTGLMLPNFQGFQGTSVDYSNPSELDLAWKQFLESKRQFNTSADLDRQKIALAGRTSGGGGTPASPFNNSLPPGYSA